MEVLEGGISGASNQVPTDSQQFQMAQQQNHPYSQLGSCWFHTGGEQTPKALNFILSILKLQKEAFHVSSFRFELIHNDSRWHNNKSMLIQILSGFNAWKEPFQVFPIKFKLISNNSRWHSNEPASTHLGSHWFCSGKNRLLSLWISFSIIWMCGKGYFTCFHSGAN